MKEIIKDIEKKYYHFAEIIDAPKKYLHFYEIPQHDGGPHIEYEGNELLIVYTERGNRFGEKRTKNPDEILYWFLEDLTLSIASEYARKNRRPNEDFRIKLFAKQEELMAKISADWANDLKMRNKKYLARK